MDSLAYLHLALAYQDSTDTEAILGKWIEEFWQRWLSKPISARLILRLFSLGITLLILTLAQVALALQSGDSGLEVAQLQRDLQQLGYYRGPVTGYFDEATDRAVRTLQSYAGLTVDGIVGRNTGLEISQRLTFGNQAAQLPFVTLPPPPPIAGYNPPISQVMFSEPLPGQLGYNQQSRTINPTLRRGDRGWDVELLQSRLADLGFYFGDIDRIYGEQTELAVSRFQRSRGLFANGIADAETLQALDINSGTRGDPSFMTVTLKGYVVVIPTGNYLMVSQVQSFYPSAIAARNRRGRYVYIGSYNNRAQAESQSALLRSQGFANARVVHFR
ncbi:peptidoglycan-binding protein [Roseofilum sp. BLCC_M154]|uniref:Peptidoglycan-binding protein n=1 Tax=Roseofilum acuticapitatum BLCC-M154 TaxID=3022444 RepID=A0ABT7AV59_9CYAN|nr:peptidoglycan-binding protein [Roseofilum acuticapitatum]MDJ1170805.1 peptidoglycan-binding protein [Roseofilum acuticapitatum BLCC-M154]